MPIFEYRCNKCGNQFEELLLTSIERRIPCPKCGNEDTEKIPSVIGGISVVSKSSYNCPSSCVNIDKCTTRRCCNE